MGLFASVALPAGVVTEIFTCPDGFEVSVNVNLCNRGNSGCAVRLALTKGGTPSDAAWIEYDYPLPKSGVLERTGIVLAVGEAIYAYASTDSVSINVNGVRAAA
ncbi:hypothetical protein DFW101_0314 [Solidesulfovibrio carbinoliphilus subsp. oakridgensis]|uniref:Uncharacterized protein n=1 Tax=Solidesulfovibrio carbinoliphilus subsp. oakridgensis TaxID=694327 RepID=G7QD25_9BACT|nr:hypothetical protein [Solidesulfovibrio carbinoliphilus]EHJ46331.1 hypothetical protein DFW101_0314 [Solidesulfovibrio carbinoliphilus subsp. oakridgensis]